MFKNAIIYRIGAGWSATVEDMEDALAQAPFIPCGATQEQSQGWVPPRGDKHTALVELVGGQRILRFTLESKSVPGSVVKRHLEERVANIEATTGRKPGRKESRDLRDDVVHELLPMAFAKTSSVLVWLDLQAQLLVLDTASQNKADAVTTALTQACPGLHLSLLNTQVAPQAAMTQWLSGTPDDWPAHFAPGHEVELKSTDAMQSVVKFTRHHLEDEEMRRHIAQGKLPTKLALDWEGRVGLVLTEGLQLRKITFLDGVMDDHTSAQDQNGFDTDLAIATGELGPLITDLIAALGGELLA